MYYRSITRQSRFLKSRRVKAFRPLIRAFTPFTVDQPIYFRGTKSMIAIFSVKSRSWSRSASNMWYGILQVFLRTARLWIREIRIADLSVKTVKIYSCNAGPHCVHNTLLPAYLSARKHGISIATHFKNLCQRFCVIQQPRFAYVKIACSEKAYAYYYVFLITKGETQICARF